MRSRRKRAPSKLGKRPDEVFSIGPIQGARFGNKLVMQSTRSDESQAKMMSKAAAEYPRVVSDIDTRVASIAAAVGSLPPDQLLSRAWFARTLKQLRIEAEAEVTDKEAIAARMVDYIQSMIAAAPRSDKQKTEVSDADWNALEAEVSALYKQLNGEYLICATAHRQQGDAPPPVELEDFLVRAQGQWCNVRGDYYSSHQVEVLSDLLRNLNRPGFRGGSTL